MEDITSSSPCFSNLKDERSRRFGEHNLLPPDFILHRFPSLLLPFKDFLAQFSNLCVHHNTQSSLNKCLLASSSEFLTQSVGLW